MTEWFFILLFYQSIILVCHSQNQIRGDYIKKMPQILFIGVSVTYTEEAVSKIPTKPSNYYGTIWIEVARIFGWHNIIYRVIYEHEWTTSLIETTTLKNNDDYTKSLKEWAELRAKAREIDASIAFLFFDSIANSAKRGESMNGTIHLGCPSVFNVGALMKENNEQRAATAISRQSGICLGLSDNRDIRCIQSQQECVMHSDEYNIVDSYPNAFSVASINQLISLNHTILEYNLTGSPSLYATCGDGFVDPGEDCDCGHSQNCLLSNEIHCCDHTQCKFHQGIKCSKGECCVNCVMLLGAVCREKSSECDIEETCPGNSADCPTDEFSQDGSVCAGGTRYCSQGKCSNYTDRCTTFMRQPVSSNETCMIDYFNHVKMQCKINPNFSELCHSDENECSFVVCESSSKLPVGKSVEISKNRFCGIVDNFMPIETNRDTSGLICGDKKGCFGGKCINAKDNSVRCSGIRCHPQHNCVMGKCVRIGALHTVCENVECNPGEACGARGICLSKDTKLIPISTTRTTKTTTETTTKTPSSTTISSLYPIIGFIVPVGSSIIICVILITLHERYHTGLFFRKWIDFFGGVEILTGPHLY